MLDLQELYYIVEQHKNLEETQDKLKNSAFDKLYSLVCQQIGQAFVIFQRMKFHQDNLSDAQERMKQMESLQSLDRKKVKQ